MCEKCGAEEILDHLLGRLEPGRERQIREHLAVCASCRAAAEEIRLVARLSEAPAVQPRPGTDQALREIISEAAARRSEKRSTTKINIPAVRRFRPRGILTTSGPSARAMAAGLAIAAALLVALVTYVVAPRKQGPAVPPAPQETARETVVPETPPAEEARPERTEPPPPTPEIRPEPAPRPPRVAPREEPPVAIEPKPPAPPPAEPPKPPGEPAPTVTERKVPAGRLLALNGKVERAGAAAAGGDTILFDDEILCRTGAALLELADGSHVALRSDTLATLVQQGEEIRVRLSRGEVACRVNRREDRFIVETPHGTATVKGTVFSVRAGALSTTVTVAEGRVEARNARGTQMVSVGHHCSMNGTAPSRPQKVDAEKSLAWAAKLGLRSLGTIWIPAACPEAEFHPPMIAGRFYAEGSLTGLPIYSPSKTYTVNGRAKGGWVTYPVEIPREGEWYLWGRFYYPGKGSQARKMDDGTDNDPNSFWVSVDGGDEREFGNLKFDPETKRSYFQRWHWDGDGTIEVGKPAPVPLGRLAAGRHAIRVRERESYENNEVRLAPRLDMLCLTPDSGYVPLDEDVRK